MLRELLEQTQPIDVVYVIDNASSARASEIVARYTESQHTISFRYHDPGGNIGPAGGWALGMQLLCEMADPRDWILILDDDNPPLEDDDVRQVFELATSRNGLRVGAAGIVGARFNWRSGLLQRVPDEALEAAIQVDYLGAGHMSMYSVGALRDAGYFDAGLFFGAVEVELGLRLRRAGYTLLSHGEKWRSRRENAGRISHRPRTNVRCVIHWQKYYRIRNYVYMMRRFGRSDLAFRWALIQCLIKPGWTLFSSPGLAWAGFRLALRATRDGWLGRMGRTVEPDAFPQKT